MTSPVAPLDVSDFAIPLERGVTLIEASAGTGKTYTVAALVLRLVVEHGLEIGQILVTTFTIPATAELRERVRILLRNARDLLAQPSDAKDPFLKALLARFQADPGVALQRLDQALRDFDEAAIHTIHGFCQRVLQDRAFESGSLFDQEFLADESPLIREVAEDYWRKRFYDCDPLFAAAAIAEKLNPSLFSDLLDRRLKHPLAALEPEGAEGELARIEASITAAFARLRSAWSTSFAQIQEHFFSNISWTKGIYRKTEMMREHFHAIAACFAVSPDLAGFPSLLVLAASALAEGTHAGRTTPQHPFFDDCETLLSSITKYALALQQDFLRWAPCELEKRKLRLNVLSYSDLLTRVHAALQSAAGPTLAAAIRSRFRAALIDEFQDTDALQEEIFRQIFGESISWLFLIGDPKQAIFGFRSADVFTYLRSAEKAQRRFTLETNYRSAAKLVEATNYLFHRVDHPFVIEGIEFRPVKASGSREAELFSGDSIASPLRIWDWEIAPGTSTDTARAEVCAAIAGEIVHLLQSNAKLGTRRIVPSDIAILTAKNDEARLMQFALSQVGVPSVLLSNASVFDSAEARDLLALLAAASHPRDEKRLRAALFTDLLGVRATEMDRLTQDAPGWEERLLQFARWHETWNTQGFIQMFRRVLLDAAVRSRMLSRIDGERRMTNLLQLSEILQRAAMESRLGPEGLTKWLAEQIGGIQTAKQEEFELRLERDDDAVRIITVHKSKGLEYNIVFCPFLWSTRDDTRRNAFRFHDPENGGRLTLDLGSSNVELHRELARNENLAENARVLYVALTRARQRCDIIWGKFKGAERSAAAWLFHPPPGQNEFPAAALEGYFKALSTEQLRNELGTLAENSAGTVERVPPTEHDERMLYAASAPTSSPSQVRFFGGQIDREWSVSSFSSLTEHHDAEAPDYDLVSHPAPIVEEAEPEGIHAFPAGTRAGILLHEILETLDFADTENLPKRVRGKLQEFAFDPALWQQPVTDCLSRLLQVRLAPGFSLKQVTNRQKRAELEFYLPARRLEAHALRELMGADDAPNLDFAPRRGWLKGFIDLVFEQEGRYFIIDWKSNRLGSQASAYSQAALAAAMAAHHYRLQYHLYTVALHRYLRSRIPGYKYDRHFGGVFYFFLRGIDPARPELGIISERPSAEVITALDEWL